MIKCSMLSAVILAKNEETNIKRCVESLNFCDEIIVIDDKSTDNTIKLAADLGAKVLSHSLNFDFSKQRNFAIEETSSDWVLFIDADEEVTGELAKNILTAVSSNLANGYYLKRRDFFWGKELKYGETQTARNSGILRLVRKNTGKWVGKVHERWVTNSRTKKLNGYINHYPHQSIIEFLQSVNSYSTQKANELIKNNSLESVLQIFVNPIGKFIYTYFIKLGFRDGPAGFAYSFMMSFHSFLVRSKLFLK